LCCSCLALLFCGCQRGGVAVNVSNRNAMGVSNLSLVYSGGQVDVPILSSGSTYEALVRPTGESSVQVTYWLGGSMMKTNLDVYIEPGYKGEVLVTIKPDGNVSRLSNVHL
jgi:hypothetical protein